ncbi:MAG: 30S ribosomal protein S8, partial [Deltaproteobacteria bacterium]|nr:30S ribosomal protein S8 [Deltaproteobacteria bacterium]
HQEVEIPWSRIKESIAFLLEDEGYLGGIKKVQLKDRVGEILLVQLKFDRDNTPVITGLKRVSRPGRRVYVGSQEIPAVRRGLGINILSTPKGILVDRKAKKVKVGGELLCSVW